MLGQGCGHCKGHTAPLFGVERPRQRVSFDARNFLHWGMVGSKERPRLAATVASNRNFRRHS